MATTTVTKTPGATSAADHGLTGWALQNARAEVVRSVLAHEATTRDGDLGWDIAAIAPVFDERGDLLRTLHQQWITALSARLDTVLELGGDDLRAEVVTARRALAAQQPSLARILDRHETDPALAVALRTERRLLAVAAGLASLAEPADVAAARGATLAGPRAGADVNRAGTSCTASRFPGLRLLKRSVRHHAAPAA